MILGVIPARGGSSLKDKNIRPLAGKPLIQWIIEAAKKSKIDLLVLSSDSDSIIKEAGIKYVKRPARLSGSRSPSEAAVNHVIDELEINPDKTILLQCTSPLTRTEDIDALIDKLDEFDSAFLAWESDALLWDRAPWVGNGIMPINHNPDKKRAMRQERMMLEEAGIYGWRGRTTSRFVGETGVCVVPKGIDINDEQDFRLAEALLRQ